MPIAFTAANNPASTSTSRTAPPAPQAAPATAAGDEAPAAASDPGYLRVGAYADLAAVLPTRPTGAPTNGKIDQLLWGKDGFSFHALLQVVNPLQQIPVVSTVYREMTGDSIGAVGRLVGGALMGGPIGVVSGLINSVIEGATGKDLGGQVYASLFGDGSKPAAAAATAVAANGAGQRPIPAAGATSTASAASGGAIGGLWQKAAATPPDATGHSSGAAAGPALSTGVAPAAVPAADADASQTTQDPPAPVAPPGRPWLSPAKTGASNKPLPPLGNTPLGELAAAVARGNDADSNPARSPAQPPAPAAAQAATAGQVAGSAASGTAGDAASPGTPSAGSTAAPAAAAPQKQWPFLRKPPIPADRTDAGAEPNPASGPSTIPADFAQRMMEGLDKYRAAARLQGDPAVMPQPVPSDLAVPAL